MKKLILLLLISFPLVAQSLYEHPAAGGKLLSFYRASHTDSTTAFQMPNFGIPLQYFAGSDTLLNLSVRTYIYSTNGTKWVRSSIQGRDLVSVTNGVPTYSDWIHLDSLNSYISETDTMFTVNIPPKSQYRLYFNPAASNRSDTKYYIWIWLRNKYNGYFENSAE